MEEGIKRLRDEAMLEWIYPVILNKHAMRTLPSQSNKECADERDDSITEWLSIYPSQARTGGRESQYRIRLPDSNRDPEIIDNKWQHSIIESMWMQ